MYMQIDPVEAWERLRFSRSRRPGKASTGARAKTYSTGLEQAHQMFQAAEGVGPQTKALLVFYGLSQAGRAIAAAATDLKGEDWNLVAHGIKTSGLDEPLPDIELRTDPPGSAGSFVRLSELLDSPVWGNDTVVSFADVWDTLPVNLKYPLTARERFTPLFAAHDPEASTHPLLSVDVGDLPDRIVDAPTREVLTDFLAHYPGTAGFSDYRRRTASGAEPDYVRHLPDAGWLVTHWDLRPLEGTPAQHRERLDRMTRLYAGYRYFFPAVPGLTREMHPLMAWWALLYALSMLTRYQPAQWAGHIDVDNSRRHAVPIERLLDRAMEHLPTLIANTIDAVSAWG